MFNDLFLTKLAITPLSKNKKIKKKKRKKKKRKDLTHQLGKSQAIPPHQNNTGK